MTAWVKGQSGNPGGRPKALGDIREIARQHTDAAIKVLINVMGDAEAAASARVGAATALLDRGWGRPAQTINASIDHGVEPDAGLIGYAGDLLATLSRQSQNTRQAAIVPGTEIDAEPAPASNGTAH